MIRNIITAVAVIWAISMFVDRGIAAYDDCPCRHHVGQRHQVRQQARHRRPRVVYYDGVAYHNPRTRPIALLPSMKWIDITAPDDYNPMELFKREKGADDTFIKFGKVRQYP